VAAEVGDEDAASDGDGAAKSTDVRYEEDFDGLRTRTTKCSSLGYGMSNKESLPRSGRRVMGLSECKGSLQWSVSMAVPFLLE